MLIKRGKEDIETLVVVAIRGVYDEHFFSLLRRDVGMTLRAQGYYLSKEDQKDLLPLISDLKEYLEQRKELRRRMEKLKV